MTLVFPFKGDYVTCSHRDVCKTGFDLVHVADAVFLDLPAPWEALPFAKKALKTEGKVGWLIKRPIRDAYLSMGGNQALPAPLAPPAPHFVFLITQ